MLYSFPGTGNHWLQLLVEFSTGLYTGSIYNNEQLAEVSPGISHCSKQVILIKLHPNHYHWDQVEQGKLSKKCVRNNVTSFSSAVLLIRHPFDAIWSEYVRSITNSHTGILEREHFNQTHFYHEAIELSKMYKYMVTKDYKLAEQYYGKHNTIYIRYEDLLSAKLREGELMRLLHFLHHSVSFPTSMNMSTELSKLERLQCAFILAEESKVRYIFETYCMHHSHNSCGARMRVHVSIEVHLKTKIVLLSCVYPYSGASVRCDKCEQNVET